MKFLKICEISIKHLIDGNKNWLKNVAQGYLHFGGKIILWVTLLCLFPAWFRHGCVFAVHSVPT